MSMDGQDSSLELLLEYIKTQRGIDFTSYKKPSLQRLLRKRLQAVAVDRYAAYLDHLQASPDEFKALLDTLFVNVTHFFRDTDAWRTLSERVLPRILDARPADAPIRVWCAGAASGEEPYTIAMLLAEALGGAAFHERVKIYATDLDEGTLARARRGVYTAAEVEDVPEQLREKYFERHDNRFTFRGDLRRCMIFGRHNLLDDAPISRLDLLICRNTLMYFNREAQDRVLARFHFALRDDGLLFLGKAEMLLTRRSLFFPFDQKARIFAKATHLSLRDRLSILSQTGSNDETGLGTVPHVQIRDLAFDVSPASQLIIDKSGLVSLVNDAARRQFALSARDVGRPFHDLELSYRAVELRGPVEDALSEHRPAVLSGIRVVGEDGRPRFYDIRVSPLPDENGQPVAVSLSFVDVTTSVDLRAQLEQLRKELDSAYEDLHSTNEELETTNEELQSTIEELETTNEELQSTNEELETMNEELQSANEEMGTINDELRDRSEAVNRLNAYMKSILASVQLGVVVLNTELEVHLWNDKAVDLWGLPEEEVTGAPFLNLDIGLPVDQLKELMLRALRGDADFGAVVLSAHNRRGKQMDCRVTCAPLHGYGNDIDGVVLMMEEWQGRESRREESHAQASV